MSKLKYFTFFIISLYFFLCFSVKPIFAVIPGYSVTPAPLCHLSLGIEVKSATNIKEFNDQVGQIYADIKMQYKNGTPPALWVIPKDTEYKTDGSILLGNEFKNYADHKIGLKELPKSDNVLYVTVNIHNDGIKGTWTLTKTPDSIKDKDGVLLPMAWMGSDCGSTLTSSITYTWTPTEVLPICTTDKPTIKSNETFTLTAQRLDKNAKYTLSLNGQVYYLDETLSKSDKYGNLTIEDIQPEEIHPSFSGDLTVQLNGSGNKDCKQTIKVTNVAEPIAGNKCCNDSSYNYDKSTNQCTKILEPNQSSNCKPGDYCFENICYTPVEVKYYRCDTPKKACIESISISGEQPNSNRATSDKDACDKSCIANGTTFASNAPAAIPTSAPPCNNDGKDATGNPCSTAGGQPCPNNSQGIMTALGCVPTEPTALVQSFLKFATGIGGAIALLLMISGAFQMITSQGNPETVKKGQEQFTSAVIGLLFIIFSVLLLQVIGFDILRIPGFL